MKRFSKLMSLLLFAAVTQYSGINDADVVIADDTHSESNGNLALFFEIPNVATSRSAESSGVTTEGSKEEYAVKSLTVYLFDSTTKTLKDQQELKNINRTVTSGQNIQYTADKITVNPGTYNIFAIANGKAITGNISTQEAFLNAVDAVTYSAGKIPSVPENGFVMTNRGAANLNVEVKKPTDSDKVTSVSIGLERVVAKVELTQTQETFPSGQAPINPTMTGQLSCNQHVRIIIYSLSSREKNISTASRRRTAFIHIERGASGNCTTLQSLVRCVTTALTFCLPSTYSTPAFIQFSWSMRSINPIWSKVVT